MVHKYPSMRDILNVAPKTQYPHGTCQIKWGQGTVAMRNNNEKRKNGGDAGMNKEFCLGAKCNYGDSNKKR